MRRTRGAPSTDAIGSAGWCMRRRGRATVAGPKVRARVGHRFGVIKLVSGFVTVRYRGVHRNANRLFVTCALSNPFVVRRRLLRLQGAYCVQRVAPSAGGAGKRGNFDAVRHESADISGRQELPDHQKPTVQEPLADRARAIRPGTSATTSCVQKMPVLDSPVHRATHRFGARGSWCPFVGGGKVSKVSNEPCAVRDRSGLALRLWSVSHLAFSGRPYVGDMGLARRSTGNAADGPFSGRPPSIPAGLGEAAWLPVADQVNAVDQS